MLGFAADDSVLSRWGMLVVGTGSSAAKTGTDYVEKWPIPPPETLKGTSLPIHFSMENTYTFKT